MTNMLLVIIILAILLQTYTTHQHRKQITATLDALAEMMGDMLRELITKIEKDKTK